MTNKTPAMFLQELSMKECGRGPNYRLITQEQGTHENVFEYIVNVLSVNATGKGRSKKEAKQETAKNALLLLKEQFNMDCVPPNVEKMAQQAPLDGEMELKRVVNYIGELDDVCLRNYLPEPVYDLISDLGPPHQKVFTYEAKLGESIVERSTASTKKQARQNVAKQILERLDGIVPLVVKEHTSDMLEICPADMEVINKYREVSSTYRRNYTIRLTEYRNHLMKHLENKKLVFEDIKKYFEKPYTEDNLSCLLKSMQLELAVDDFSEDKLYIVSYSVNTEVPLSTLGCGVSLEIAKYTACIELLRQMETISNVKTYNVKVKEGL